MKKRFNFAKIRKRISRENKTHLNQKTKSLKIKNDLRILNVLIIIKKVNISSIISNRN